MFLISPAYAQAEVLEKSFGVFEREGIFAVLLFFSVLGMAWFMKKWSDAKVDLAKSEAGRRADLEKYTTKVEEYATKLGLMVVDATKSDVGLIATSEKQTQAILAVGKEVAEAKGAVNGVLAALKGRGN